MLTLNNSSLFHKKVLDIDRSLQKSNLLLIDMSEANWFQNSGPPQHEKPERWFLLISQAYSSVHSIKPSCFTWLAEDYVEDISDKIRLRNLERNFRSPGTVFNPTQYCNAIREFENCSKNYWSIEKWKQFCILKSYSMRSAVVQGLINLRLCPSALKTFSKLQ